MVQIRRKEQCKCNEQIRMLVQKGANYSVVSATTLLIGFNIKFYPHKQHETNPLLSNQLPYNNISSESKFHTNPMWRTCKIDLIHDARHLCTRLRTDGIKVMSNGFSGGKQVINIINTRKSNEYLSRPWNSANWAHKLTYHCQVQPIWLSSPEAAIFWWTE